MSQSVNMNDLKSKAVTAFNKIGTSNGTAPPHSEDNRAAIAHEFFVSDALAAVAKKRRETAIDAAVEAGVLPKKGEDRAGTTRQTYDNEYLACSVQVKQPAVGIDKTALTSELTKKYGKTECDRIMKIAEKTNAPATSYIVSTK